MQLFIRNVEGIYFSADGEIGEDGNYSATIVPMRGVLMDDDIYANILMKAFEATFKGTQPSVAHIDEANSQLAKRINAQIHKLVLVGKVVLYDMDGATDLAYYGYATGRHTTDGFKSNSPYAYMRKPVSDSSQTIH